ncbi:alpha/beta fold hydrolase [Reichenbachiella sp.]|uniref:alpha/beta fold hydrolase n=1 Tax=Reichenbachiella sp. TaxID=2184521 RepID=UPI003BB18700
MSTFSSNSVSLTYKIYGEGNPILLPHGGCVDFNYNYYQTGWVDTLTNNGFQVIGLDFRGHGNSDRSTDPSFYGLDNLSNDVMNLIHHLSLKSAVIMGYSMGTVIALNLLHKHPDFFSKAILIGTGDVLIGQPPFEKIVQGLGKVFDFETFPDHLPKHVSAYWSFFKELGLDRESMKAFSKASYPNLSIEEVESIQVPTLIISGENDLVLGQGKQVAQKLVNGEYSEIKNTDHFTLAIEPNTHHKAIDYLKRT